MKDLSPCFLRAPPDPVCPATKADASVEKSLFFSNITRALIIQIEGSLRYRVWTTGISANVIT